MSWFRKPKSKWKKLVAGDVQSLLDDCRGAHTIDVIIRKDGKDIQHQGDSLKYIKEFTVD